MTSACFCSRSSTTHAINRQRNTHVGVYDTSVKCAWRYSYPQHTTESIYNTLRGIICTFVLDCIRFVEVSNSQKQSVSNAFNYVVPCPSVTLFHQSILGRCKRKNTKTWLNQSEKVQKVFMHKHSSPQAQRAHKEAADSVHFMIIHLIWCFPAAATWTPKVRHPLARVLRSHGT